MRLGSVWGLCALLNPALNAAPAITTLHENEVTWGPDGTVTARVYQTSVTGGINGNYWPVLRAGGTSSIGQTFRCHGPRLTGIQLGLDDVDTGYRGLNWRNGRPCAVRIELRRHGPTGELVAHRLVEAKGVSHSLPLTVDVPTGPADVWYVGVTPQFGPGTKTEFVCNANRHDTYPRGCLFLDGDPVNGDLFVRVTRSRRATARRAPPALLWASPPEARLWMEPDRTVGHMLADDPARPFRVRAVRNERVSFQLTVTPWPETRIRRAELRILPFTGPGGVVIPDDAVRIEWLRYSLDFKRGRTSGRLYPDPLAPTHVAAATAGEPDAPLNRTFWVSLRIPLGVPAGLYRAEAAVTVNDESVLRRVVELDVLDIDLPRETHTRTGLFRQNGGTLVRHLWWTRDLAEFRVALGDPFYRDLNNELRNNGFSEASYQRILGPEMRESLVAFGRLANELGLHVTNVTPWGDSYRALRGEAGAEQGIVRFWATYHPLLEKYGWTEQAYCRIPDELKGDRIHGARRIVELFHEHAPDVPVLLTSMGTADVTELMKAIGLADIWCQDSRYMPLALDFYRQRLAEGEEVWPYIHDFTWHVADPAVLRLYFWMLEKHGFGGACYFAVKRARFEPAWHGVVRRSDTWPGDGDLYYDAGTPPANVQGLWRSARLYRIGDGIEDRECFRLMNRLAERGREAGTLEPGLAAKVAAVNAGLQETVRGMVNIAEDSTLPDRVRRDLLDVVLALSETLP